MLIGYGRISTTDQDFALQRDALTEAGCEKIFEDTMSGARADRPGLNNALEVSATLIGKEINDVKKILK